jgi:hypothetical protein
MRSNYIASLNVQHVIAERKRCPQQLDVEVGSIALCFGQ